MKVKVARLVLAAIFAITLTNCGTMGYAPEIKFSPGKPIVAKNLDSYRDKRAVLLAFAEPDSEKGLGKHFSSSLFIQLLRGAPFAHVSNRPDEYWFGLQSTETEEFSTAAAIGRELGYDAAVFGEIERFVYSRNADSTLVIRFNVVDTMSGELIHSQRIIAKGYIGNLPPFYDVSNNKAADREDIFMATANNIVRRLMFDWSSGETMEESVIEEEEG